MGAVTIFCTGSQFVWDSHTIEEDEKSVDLTSRSVMSNAAVGKTHFIV